MAWVLGFGVLGGLGIGFGYSSATPPALKWFPPFQTGKVAGVVVAGFGLAPLYIAPLTDFLMRKGGVSFTTAFYAAFFLFAVCGLATFLRNPEASIANGPKPRTVDVDSVNPSALFFRKDFYLLWMIYFVASGAGLMVISSINGMAKKSMGELAFLAVVVLGDWECSGPGHCRGCVRQDRSKVDPAGCDSSTSWMHDSGYPCDSDGGLYFSHCPSRDRDWIQLWSEPLSFSCLCKRFVRLEELWNELWDSLYGLGSRRIFLKPCSADAQGIEWGLRVILSSWSCFAWTWRRVDVDDREAEERCLGLKP